MSVLEKLIYVCDKIEPLRKYDTTKAIKKCVKNFEKGFIYVLKNNRDYLQTHAVINDNNSLECFNYYLK